MNRSTWALLFAFAMTAVFLVIAVRGLDWGAFRSAMGSADVRWLIPVCLLVLVDLAIRALRWRLLLAPIVGASWGMLYRLEAIGMAANNVIPGRIGEFGRAALASRRLGVPFLSVFSTVAVERLCDVIAILTVFNTAAWLYPDAVSATLRLTTQVMLAGGAGVLILLVFAHRSLEPGGLLHRWLGAWPKMRDLFGQLVTGARALRTWRVLPILGLSMLLWFMNVSLFWLVGKAMHIGFLDFGGSMVVMGWAMVGAAIPAAPGAVGTFEALVRAAMESMGATGSLALAYAVVLHIMSYIMLTLAGLIFLPFEGISLGEFRKSAQQASSQERT